MLAKSKIALTAAILILGAASASLAKDAGPPNLDIQKTCRESSDALTGLTANSPQDNFNACMSDEQTAHDQLVKDWATYPALAKAQCVKPKESLPGYVEWQSCIEMTRDVIKMRQDQAAAAPAGSNAGRQSSSSQAAPGTRECPVVQTAEDGSVDWVINC
jgi:hypothetical protein